MKIFALFLAVILVSSSIGVAFASEPNNPDPEYQKKVEKEATEVKLKHKGISPEPFRKEFLAFADSLADKQRNNKKISFDDIVNSREFVVSSTNLKVYFTSRDNVGDQRSCVMSYGPDKCLDMYREYLKSLHEGNGALVYANSDLYDQCRDRIQDRIKQCLTAKSDNIDVTEVQISTISSIPSWIKNNAGWWADGTITDSEFISGIQYLISNGLIKVPETTQSKSSSEIPSWIKQNAKWWSDGIITDDEFLNNIQYLVINGIVKI